MNESSLLGDLIDLHAALRADRTIDPDHKKQRDRRIGTTLPHGKHRPVQQLRGWLARVDIPGWERTGHTAVQLHRLVGVILALLGLATGWGLAQAVLHYTGDAPINIVNVLVVLILPQLLLLLLWCLAAIPVRLPLIGSLRSTLGFLNPGRLARALVQRLPSSAEQRMDGLWDADNAIAMAPAARWQVSFWSQLFSVAFNIGALLAFFYLIAFSDLAFGWSTTLVIDSTRFHGVVAALSWPWHAVVPEAVPSIGLVEASRYYRLDAGRFGGAMGAGQAAQLGGWWPFLVAAIVSYGLLPRVITLAISRQRLRHHLCDALVRLPGAPELLARMNSPLISTAAPRPEVVHAVETADIAPRTHAAGEGHPFTLVAWSGSVANAEPLRPRLVAIGIEQQELLHAGGAQSTEEDQASIAALCTRREHGVAIIVKAWEPPLLEFVDFVQQVRARCKDGQPIVVLLWGGGAPVSDSDLQVWSLSLRPLKDPNLHVEAIP
jgi:hypothetical protein